MKRTPMGPRKAPMRRGPWKRSAPAPQVPRPRSALPDGEPTPRPVATTPAVTPQERSARRIVRERSGGMCERCGKARATDWSHRVAEGHGGPWCPANGLDLCRPCHRWGHHRPAAAEVGGWLLPSWVDYRTTPARHWLHGLVLLTEDGMYVPVPESEASR